MRYIFFLENGTEIRVGIVDVDAPSFKA